MDKKGTKITENIYDTDDFHIRFFTKEDIKFFINDNFEIQKIIEGYEEPVGLYFVFLIITIFVLLQFLMEVSWRFYPVLHSSQIIKGIFLTISVTYFILVFHDEINFLLRKRYFSFVKMKVVKSYTIL